eukprot:m.69326 g.69326  ORF g.69326 m.69326 type:complete len:148 (-) comp16026_c0_seq1:1010-1453(-)
MCLWPGSLPTPPFMCLSCLLLPYLCSGTWFSHDAPTEDQEQEWLPDMSNLPSGNRAPHEKRSSLAQRYYSRIKDGPPPDDTADEEEAPSAAQPAVVMTPTATTGSTTRRVSAISYPKPKQPEPTPVCVHTQCMQLCAAMCLGRCLSL